MFNRDQIFSGNTVASRETIRFLTLLRFLR